MNLIYGRSPNREEYERAHTLYGGNESGFLCLSCAEVSRFETRSNEI